MVIDTKRCVGCADCVIGCKMENEVPGDLHRDWIAEETHGKFPDLQLEIRSERCNHCENPPCVHACPTGASHIKEGTNITLVTANKCTGCKACVAANQDPKKCKNDSNLSSTPVASKELLPSGERDDTDMVGSANGTTLGIVT